MGDIHLPDGRTFSYRELGDPGGTPVLALHGTPGSSRQLQGLGGPAQTHGMRLILPDRAGYGGSTHDTTRTLSSDAGDNTALLEHLGIDRVAVAGLSGGGPHALALAACRPDRVTAVATIGGVAPMSPRDPSLPPDRLFTRIAGWSEAGARAIFGATTWLAHRKPEAVLDRFAKAMAPADAAVLRDDPATRHAMLDDFRHPSPTTARATARDFALFAKPWDIDLGHIAAHVDVWHGDEDRNVPVQHGHLLARLLPDAELHEVSGGGHLLLGELDAVLTALTAG